MSELDATGVDVPKDANLPSTHKTSRGIDSDGHLNGEYVGDTSTVKFFVKECICERLCL